MHNILIVLFALFMIGGVGTSKISKAEDFNFTVPVQLYNITSEVSALIVDCGTNRDQNFSEAIGHGLTSIPMPDNGNYSGNVVVRFNAKSGKDPNDATFYHCYLRFEIQLESGAIAYAPVGPNSTENAAQPKPGSVFVGEVSGNIQ